MKPSLQKLTKFFKLEADRDYDNRAVMGGLNRMLGPWEAEARLDQVPEDLIRAVNDRLRDYEHLTPASRAETLEGLWRRIQRETGENLPALSASQKEKGEATKPAHPKPEKHLPEAGKEAQQAGPEVAVEGEDQAPTPTLPEEKPVESPESVSSPTVPHRPLQPRPTGAPAAFQALTTILPGVGPRHAQTLTRLGIRTLGDMLYYFPRRYDDYTQLRPINRLFYGEDVTVIGTLQTINNRPIRSGSVQITEAVLSDGSGALRLTWFNQPWVGKRLRPGMQVVISGKIEQYLGRLVMNNPELEPLEQQNLHTNRIVPVYPLTANITERWLRRLLYQVVSYWAPRVQDPLPDSLRQEAALIDLPTALYQAHFPDNWDLLKAARQRLAFDEVFYLQLGVLRQKHAWQNRTARVFEVPEDWLEAQINRLPFPLTGAQQRALADVCADLSSGRPMNRLLQGDVGSGKTVIAALAMAMVARHGSQAALMAPTSILAEQHYQNLLRLLAGVDDTGHDIAPALRPEQIRLMLGATPEAEKREIRQGLESGEIKIVIGTHALIEEPVVFADLQMAVVDEQHRFGVDQRAILRSKGDNPHLMVMTATPIPRSLALTVYGDLDLSVMDEMPPGRQPVETHVLYPRELERAYALIRTQLDKGKQAFVIYPLVEESETSESKAAVEEQQRLKKEIFPKQRVGLLHGRMKAEEKDQVMTQFRDREIDILVATTVVEVGVDIPNATVMLIEGANRFGLSQLHQLRGRVGRSGDQAFCILVPETPDAVENERLKAVEETNDGFILAERDLEQRGPGQFLGTRQAGYSELKLASLTDVLLIEKARKLSQRIFEKDPDLTQPEHQMLAEAVKRFWGGDGETPKGDIS